MSEIEPAGSFVDGDPASREEPSHLITTIPTKREAQIKRPGHINFVTQNGNFPGSRIIYFYKLDGKPYVAGLEKSDYDKFKQQCEEEKPENVTEAINLFFKHRSNLLTVGMWPGNYIDSFYIAYTQHLDGEALEYWQKASEIQSKLMSEWEKMKTEEREKAAAEIKAKRAEELELIELGKKVKEHNIIEENRKLKEELKKLKKYAKDNGGIDE